MRQVRNIVIAAAVTAPILAAAAPAPAPTSAAPVTYPVKVVTLVTHSSPGSGSDVVLREQLKYLQRYINATFIVENDEGGSGAKAVSRVAAAKPDGSMFYASTPTYVLTSLMSRPPNTYKDLEPLVNFFNDSEVVYTRIESPYKTLNDAIE